MARGTRSYARQYFGGGGLPQGVKGLIIANSVIFLLMWLVGPIERVFMQWFALYPADVVTRFYLWELVTYLFLHGGFMHILMNMLYLWFFGKDLEDIWGTRRFLQFYFFCGVGAGVIVVLANYLFGNPPSARRERSSEFCWWPLSYGRTGSSFSIFSRSSSSIW
jgi:membrane associated rhomboid family serine protease